MAIQNIKANKTASLTDLREPRKIIEALADGGEVAILDRNKVVAYMRGPDAVTAEQTFRYATKAEFDELLPQVLEEEKEVLDYLKDK
jgi:antitoxin (DNA-binding transcriptional repressor) of toxin-antitoxin stability system